MTPPKTPLTSRTVITGVAMMGAAFIAFSLNQGGLTGRATGGAVGCGGGDPEVGASAQPLVPNGRIELGSEPAAVIPTGEVIPLQPRLRLARDGKTLERFFVDDLEQPRATPVEPDVVMPPIRVDRVGTLWERFEKDGLSGWMSLIEKAEMRPIFEDDQAELTVLVPSSEALESLSPALREGENRAILQAYIQHHIILGRHFADEVPGGAVETALPEQPLFWVEQRQLVGSHGDVVHLKRVNSETDMGMVHVIDGVLRPKITLQVMLLQHGFTLFAAMVEQSGYVHEIANPDVPMTVLAVSDRVLADAGIELDHIRDGMDGMVRSIVENHVIYGGVSRLDPEQKLLTLSDHQVRAEGDGHLFFSNGAELDVIFGDVHGAPAVQSENGPIWEVDGIVALLNPS